MLDSSPVALGPSIASSNKTASTTETLPNPRKLLKRSASTASLASLPTPPRTRRRHARGRSRASVESDSDTYEDRGGDDAIVTSDDDEAARRHAGDEEESGDEAATAGHHSKRRRVGDARLDAADEEAFWLGGPTIATAGGPNNHAGQDPVATSNSNSKASQAPLLYRRLQGQATAVSVTLDAAPVSPPPSHRKAAPVAPPAPAAEEEPASRFSSPSPSPPSTPSRNPRSQTLTSTPPPKHARLGAGNGAGPLFRHSPDNPFLVTPVKQKGGEGEGLDSDTDVRSPSASVTASSADPSPHTPSYGERPTVTYVFRGVRRTYQNPLYNHAENRPYSPPPQSRLPIDHPDYSPSVLCEPKVLFADARFGRGHGRGKSNHAQAKERTKRAERSASPSPTPGRANFGRKTALGAGAGGAAGRKGQRGRFRAGSVSGDEADGEHEAEKGREREMKPKKLDFGAPVGGAAGEPLSA